LNPLCRTAARLLSGVAQQERLQDSSILLLSRVAN
jgi:hypothetical protein